MSLNVDDVLRYLAPITPAIVPIVVYVWYRTRQELHAIRVELATVREALSPDPRLDHLVASVEALRAQVLRLNEAAPGAARIDASAGAAVPRLER